MPLHVVDLQLGKRLAWILKKRNYPSSLLIQASTSCNHQVPIGMSINLCTCKCYKATHQTNIQSTEHVTKTKSSELFINFKTMSRFKGEDKTIKVNLSSTNSRIITKRLKQIKMDPLGNLSLELLQPWYNLDCFEVHMSPLKLPPPIYMFKIRKKIFKQRN